MMRRFTRDELLFVRILTITFNFFYMHKTLYNTLRVRKKTRKHKTSLYINTCCLTTKVLASCLLHSDKTTHPLEPN